MQEDQPTLAPLIHVEDFSIVRTDDGRLGYKSKLPGTRQHNITFGDGKVETRNYDELVEIVFTPAQLAAAYLTHRLEEEAARAPRKANMKHFIDAISAFMEWDESDMSPQGIVFRRERDKLAFTTKGVIFCHVCGMSIPKGERAYRTTGFRGRDEDKYTLMAMHTAPCIPVIEIEITYRINQCDPNETETALFCNYRPHAKWGEQIAEANIRTLEQAKEFAVSAAHALGDYTEGWMSYVIRVDGVALAGGHRLEEGASV